MENLPEKTVERLSEYRRTLIKCLDKGKTQIYSHEIAELQNLTAVQVRRDFMFIGYSNPNRKGYNIQELIDFIGNVIDDPKGISVALIGLGHFGKAISAYFRNKRSKLSIVAAFDTNPEKVGILYNDIPCFSVDELKAVAKHKNIKIAILTVPPQYAAQMTKNLEAAGIRGILNFTSETLHVSDQIYVEDYDMTTSIEKVAYFVKNK